MSERYDSMDISTPLYLGPGHVALPDRRRRPRAPHLDGVFDAYRLLRSAAIIKADDPAREQYDDLAVALAVDRLRNGPRQPSRG